MKKVLRDDAFGKCDICSVTYRSEMVVIQHLLSQKHHKRLEHTERAQQRIVSHNCQVCGVGAMKNMNEWNNHINSVLHQDNFEQFKAISIAQGNALKDKYAANSSPKLPTPKLIRFIEEEEETDEAKSTKINEKEPPVIKVIPPLPLTSKVIRLDAEKVTNSNNSNKSSSLNHTPKSNSAQITAVSSQLNELRESRSPPRKINSTYRSMDSSHPRAEAVKSTQQQQITRSGRPSDHNPYTQNSSREASFNRYEDRPVANSYPPWCLNFPPTTQPPISKNLFSSQLQNNPPYQNFVGNYNQPTPQTFRCYAEEPMGYHWMGGNPNKANQGGDGIYGKMIWKRGDKHRSPLAAEKAPPPMNPLERMRSLPPPTNSATFARMHEVWEISEGLDKLKQQQISLELYMARLQKSLEQTKAEKNRLKERRSLILKEMDQSDSPVESDADDNLPSVYSNERPVQKAPPTQSPSAPIHSSNVQPPNDKTDDRSSGALLPTPIVTQFTSMAPSEVPSDKVPNSSKHVSEENRASVAFLQKLSPRINAIPEPVSVQPQFRPPPSIPVVPSETKRRRLKRPTPTTVSEPGLDLDRLKRIREVLHSPASLEYTFDELDQMFEEMDAARRADPQLVKELDKNNGDTTSATKPTNANESMKNQGQDTILKPDFSPSTVVS